MSRKRLLVVTLLAALLALPVATQEEENTIARIVFFRAKPGMNQQLEDGMKKHMAWHKAQKGTWAWLAWSVETGEATGMYGAGTFGHKWSDFDNVDVNEAADAADVTLNISPYVAEGAQWRFYSHLTKVSRPRPQQAGPAARAVVLTFHLRMEGSEEFMNAITKVHNAIEKTKWPTHYEWYALVNGGEHPEFVLVLPKDNWAAMAPPDTPFNKMLEEAFGRTEADAILRVFDKTIKSETSEIVRMRPDLGYTPAPAPAAK